MCYCLYSVIKTPDDPEEPVRRKEVEDRKTPVSVSFKDSETRILPDSSKPVPPLPEIPSDTAIVDRSVLRPADESFGSFAESHSNHNNGAPLQKKHMRLLYPERTVAVRLEDFAKDPSLLEKYKIQFKVVINQESLCKAGGGKRNRKRKSGSIVTSSEESSDDFCHDRTDSPLFKKNRRHMMDPILHDQSVSIVKMDSFPVESEDIDFVPTDWLQKFFDATEMSIPSIHNKPLACEHRKLAPPPPNSNTVPFKIVPSSFVSDKPKLYPKYV